jgi:hypothetical protein
MSELISTKIRLRDCDPWPTMQWLAQPVAARLKRLVTVLNKGGEPVYRSDVVAALVLDCKATSADELWSIIRPYKAEFARPHRRRGPGAVPVTLQLPSPVSLRIDVLVENAREKATAYRHDLIGALTMAAPVDLRSLDEVLASYRDAVAGEAVPLNTRAERVLGKKRPDPGPRRWRVSREEALRSSR